uniref:Uncharacterized protein n=1 Tax=Clytia hemisphaerica TaxID=252671 RepID=A0A7M5UUQ4_9CNID
MVKDIYTLGVLSRVCTKATLIKLKCLVNSWISTKSPRSLSSGYTQSGMFLLFITLNETNIKRGLSIQQHLKRLTTLDKHSIDKTIKSAHDSLKETFKSFAPGFVFYCRRDMSHTNRNTDPKDN